MDVLLKRVKANAVTASEAKIFIFELYRFSAYQMAVSEKTQLPPPLLAQNLYRNANVISHSTV
jgi:hypothetical protein